MLKRGFTNPMVYIVLPFVWFISSIISILIVIVLLLNVTDGKIASQINYTAYAAKPLILGVTTTRLETDDARAGKIEGIFRKYKCPLEGTGKTFVQEANKNNIPYWLVASIAFQESSCGKKPAYHDDVEETYNAWGWGVWGSNVKTFDSWEHGISVVSKYMGDRFFSKGVTDTCEIMRIYTPPSDGSWCRGVNYFAELIDTYQSPNL